MVSHHNVIVKRVMNYHVTVTVLHLLLSTREGRGHTRPHVQHVLL